MTNPLRVKAFIAVLVSGLTSTAYGHPTGDVQINELGTVQIGGYSVSAKQVGTLVPGEGATYELYVRGGPEIKVVRAWVGTEEGRESVKTKAVKTPEYFDADLEIPDPIPEKSSVWVEIESADQQKARGAFPLPQVGSAK
jgi:hypothetical protein